MLSEVHESSSAYITSQTDLKKFEKEYRKARAKEFSLGEVHELLLGLTVGLSVLMVLLIIVFAYFNFFPTPGFSSLLFLYGGFLFAFADIMLVIIQKNLSVQPVLKCNPQNIKDFLTNQLKKYQIQSTSCLEVLVAKQCEENNRRCSQLVNHVITFIEMIFVSTLLGTLLCNILTSSINESVKEILVAFTAFLGLAICIGIAISLWR